MFGAGPCKLLVGVEVCPRVGTCAGGITVLIEGSGSIVTDRTFRGRSRGW